MPKISDISHPLIRDGRSQEERQFKGLSIHNVALDDRRIEQVLEFIHQYALQVNYYDEALNRGDWVPFFKNQLPFQIARISQFDLTNWMTQYEGLKANLQIHRNFERVNVMIDYLAESLYQFESWRKDLPRLETQIGTLLTNLINSNLTNALRQLIAITNAAQQWQNNGEFAPGRSLSQFRESWPLLSPVDLFAVDQALSQQKSADRYRIERAEKKLDEIYDVCQKSFKRLIQETPGLLKEFLNNPNGFQEPHVGLFYAFLSLFDETKTELNGLVEQHLDFFYTQVLGIRKKTAVSDQAHLIFQLAKGLPPSKIEVNTAFKAGIKDKEGNEVTYQLEKETIIDHAVLESLKTLYLDLTIRPQLGAGADKPSNIVHGAYIAPTADSSNGQGEAFQTENASWVTLGNGFSKMSVLDDNGEEMGKVKHPYANLGIVLASDVFLAREGTRHLTLSLTCTLNSLRKEGIEFNAFEAALTTPQFALTNQSQEALGKTGTTYQIKPRYIDKWITGEENFKSQILNNVGYSSIVLEPLAEKRHSFQLAFTGEKEWVAITGEQLEIELKKETDNFKINFVVKLDPGQEAILPFDEETHQFPLGITSPAIRILFNQEYEPEKGSDILNASLYHFLRFIEITQVDAVVEVEGLKGVVLQNQLGVLDPTKPFQPFGPRPVIGSEFYVGSKELFQKELKKVELKMSWEGLPDIISGDLLDPFEKHYQAYREPNELPTREKFTSRIEFLLDGEWEEKTFEPPMLFSLLDENGVFYSKLKIDEGKSESPQSIPAELVQLLPDTRNGFLKLVLLDPQIPDLIKQSVFLHEEYPIVLATQLLAKGLDIEDPEKVPPEAIVLDEKYGISLAQKFMDDISQIKNELKDSNEGFISKLEIINSELVMVYSFDEYEEQFSKLIDEINSIEEEVANETQQKLKPILDKKEDIQLLFTSLNDLLASYKDEISTGNNSDLIDKGKSLADEQLTDIESLHAPLNDLFICLSKYNTGESTIPIPNEPYTPTAKDLSIDYTAQADKSQMDFYHLHPFEGTYLKHDWTGGNPSVLPLYEDQGNLYLGLKDVNPGSNLNLLFQLAESTADPYGERTCILWQYLAENTWKDLRPEFEILADGTNGLLEDGIIEFALPWDIDTNHTVMPPDVYWIKASTPERSEGVGETLAIHTQAAQVVFNQKGQQSEKETANIEAGLIAKPVNNIGFLKKIEQPYPSFGGKVKEPSANFYRRVSERLRHKGRAITLNDWENLVLEAFPEVFKAKCITHTLGRLGRNEPDLHLAGGFVTLAVIPDLSKLPHGERLEPKFSLADLERIDSFLKKRASPFVRLRVLNPQYERIRVEANIHYARGYNEAFYSNELKKDLLGFLSPWTAGDSNKISFGGTVYKSEILQFIEQRPYVDYLTDLLMIDVDVSGNDQSAITSANARSILISGVHQFQVLDQCSPSVQRDSSMTGIGYLPVRGSN